MQRLQSLQPPPVLTNILVSPNGFTGKIADSKAAPAAVGGADPLQSLFSSIELETSAAHIPAGAFSLADIEKKLQTDISGQQSFDSQATPSLGAAGGIKQCRSGQVLMQPSVYAASSLPSVPTDAREDSDLLMTSHKEIQPTILSSTNKSGLQKDSALRLPDHRTSIFPSIPPLMLSAGMKAAPLKEAQKEEQEPPLQQHKVHAHVMLQYISASGML